MLDTLRYTAQNALYGLWENIMKLWLMKRGGMFYPASETDREVAKKIKSGVALSADVVRPRNYEYHKRFFAMLHAGYKYWEPDEIDTKYGKPIKSFDPYREWLTIKAGYFDVVARPDGSVSLRAKSISFASMDDNEFSQVYSAVHQQLINTVFATWTEDDVNRAILDEMMSFM